MFIYFHMFPQHVLKGLRFGLFSCLFASDKNLLTRQSLASWEKCSNAKSYFHDQTLIVIIILKCSCSVNSTLCLLQVVHHQLSKHYASPSLHTHRGKRISILATTTTKMSDNSMLLYFNTILCKFDTCFQNIPQSFIFLFKCF